MSQANNSSISEVSEEASSNNSFQTETQRGFESKSRANSNQRREEEDTSSSDEEQSQRQRSGDSDSNEADDDSSEGASQEVTGGHSSQTRFDMKSGMRLEHHHRSSYEETSSEED